MTLRQHPDEIVNRSTSPLLSVAPSWERVRLAEVADVVNGAAFKSSLFNNDRRGEPLVRIRDVGGDEAQVHYDGPYEKRHVIDHGDLLIGMDGDFRVARWGGGRALLNQRVCRVAVKDPDLYNERLLLHVLQPYLDAVHAVTSSVTVKHLSSRTVQDLPIPLPPRAEQERIVTAIEEHLSRLDAAANALQSGNRRMATLQQRLVDAAMEGGIASLGDLLHEPLRNGLSARASADGSIRMVTLTAVTRSAFIDDNTKLIEPSARPVDDLWMRPGDIFVQRSNTPELVGTAALFDGPADWAIFPDLLIRVRVDRDRVEPAYLALVLRSTTLRRYFQRSAQGIAGSMPKISQPVVEAAPIPLPGLKRQREILDKVTLEAEAAGRLGLEARRAERRAQSLRRSILAAAFSGQLVPQDPDDEPASVLLERIRAERLASIPAKRIRKASAR